MRFLIGILLLFAGVTLSPSPVMAQTGHSPQIPMLASLRSGNPLRVTHALERLQQNALAQSLYADLYRIAGSEPPSSLEASAVAKALGFVLLVGLDGDMEPLTAEEHASGIARLETLLSGIDPTVSNVAEEFQWRAVELMQFATAYDFLRAARGSALPEAEASLARFADNAALRLRNAFVVRNNLSIKLAAATGHAALVLRDGSYPGLADTPDGWFEAAWTHIDETLFRYQSGPEGREGYSEGPWYFRYAMQNLIPFFLAIDAAYGDRAFEVRGTSVRSPLHDERYHRLFEWIATLRMPDGMLPPFEDTYMQAWFPEAAAVATAQPGLSYLAWDNFENGLRLMQAPRLSNELSRSFDMRVEYLLSEAEPQTGTDALPRHRVLPEAGYAVFRSDWNADALYFALIGKHGIARTHRSPVGSGHKHANETGFVLHAGGELLAIEPGYHCSDERAALVFGENHNILLVDGRGPDSTSWGTFLFGVDAYMADTLTGEDAGMVAARTSYGGADIERRAAMIGGRFVVLADRANSPLPRDFTHQLHGNGLLADGSYEYRDAGQSAMWTRNGMRLHAVIASPSGTPAQQTVTRRHAPAGRQFAEHSALYSTVHASEARFHTVLCAAPADETVASRILRQGDGVSIVAMSAGGSELVSLFNASGASVSADLPAMGSVRTDALAMHCIPSSAGRPETWMLDEGSFLQADGRQLLSSSLFLRAVAVFDGSDIRLNLRACGDGIALPDGGSFDLALRVSRTVRAVEGAGLRSWELTGSMLHLRLGTTDTDLRIGLTSSPTSVIDDQETAHGAAAVRAPELQVFPQPARSGETLQCLYTLPAPGSVRLALHDALGRVVSVSTGLAQAPGTSAARLSTAGLAPGMYFVRLHTAYGAAARRVVLR